MDSNPEKREKPRFLHESRVVLEHDTAGVRREARMYNFNAFGLYFETDMRLEKETEIRIGIHNSPFEPDPDKFEWYHGAIQWCEALERSSYFYGYGVKLSRMDTADEQQDGFQGARTQRRHSCSLPLEFKLDKRTFPGTMDNVSSDGAAVKSEVSVIPGKRVTIEIPLKRKGKTAILNGIIAWSNPREFGVKFLKSK